MNEPIRLHKLLAQMGVASRRAAEKMIAEGRVSVNGRIVNTPGAMVSPEDEIKVDGKLVRQQPKMRYILLNKPAGILSTAKDERGRKTVIDLLGQSQRVYPVGRLDKDSEGLMLLTNDGELAQRITHPRYGVHKQYMVEVEGYFSDRSLQDLLQGVELEDGFSKPLDAKIISRSRNESKLLITMGEGRKRQVRRTLAALGYKVTRLIRVALGPLSLGELKPGEYRELSDQEAKWLRSQLGLTPEISNIQQNHRQ